MSVLDYDQFDLISMHKDGYVVLTISDHLPWDEEEEHLIALQTKINNYLDAIESGQLVDQYPEAIEKEIVIQIIAQFRPNEIGYEFLRSANKTLRTAGYRLNIAFIDDGQIVVEEIE
jgi:hypothetical protein